jgi:hypothetical protein
MQRNKSARAIVILAVTLLLSFASCDHDKKDKKDRKDKTGGKEQEQSHSAVARDWNRFPAIIERTTDAEVIALGDVHGGYDRLVSLLSRAGIIKSDRQAPVGGSWSGGNRVLVSVGDLIDKGDHSIGVLDLMMTLEEQAHASGGEVIVTLGNHEAEFLADPENKKAREFVAELQSKGIDSLALPNGQKPYGEWMMNRPLAARVNDWFFAHAGNTSGETIDELTGKFRHEVDQGNWGSRFLIGDDSLLEAEKWWKQKSQTTRLLDDYLRALSAKHIVFGHDPGAFHNKGEIGQEEDGRIFLIDVGMSPAIDYSKGALLLITSNRNEVVANSLDAAGRRSEVWRGTGSRRGNP